MAVTAEQEATYVLEYTLLTIAFFQNGGKGTRPKMRDYPDGQRDQEDREALMIHRARAWRAAHPELVGHPEEEPDEDE